MHSNRQKDAANLAFEICSAIYMVWYVHCVFIFLYKYIYIYIYCASIFVSVVWSRISSVEMGLVFFPPYQTHLKGPEQIFPAEIQESCFNLPPIRRILSVLKEEVK